MKTLSRCIIFVLLSLALVRLARAHPVAQGAVDLQLSPEKIALQVRVSSEEVLVADAFTAGVEREAGTLAEVWQNHGWYLLQHLRVFADGKLVPGRVIKVAAGQNDWVVYQFEFAVASPPAQVRVEEDVLNEIEFAPGNPWEASYVVRVHQEARLLQEGLLLSRQQPLVVACDWSGVPPGGAVAPLDRGHLVSQYVRHGLGHILSGYDHLLFVCALALGAVTFRDLIKVVTAFTLAHTLTLTLAVLNIVRLPSQLVEPMIAGSIVFVAVANCFGPTRGRGTIRLATAFFFGLFHGLGFAGGLLDAMDGMSGMAVGGAIAAFSLGVELGHQLVVLPLFFGLKLARATRADDRSQAQLAWRLRRGGSLLISVAGTVYLIAALRQ